MFTGIIENIGIVESIENLGGDNRMVIDAGKMNMDNLKDGDSIAVNGVCLTVTGPSGSLFTVDVSAETLAITNLGQLETGSKVNLERPLQISDRLHGHIVSGHVDCIGNIKHLEPDGRSVRINIGIPDSFQRYISKKGSVCVDGISLTINEKSDDFFSVNIIPHTLENTIISDYQPGTFVNIEVDIIARYLESLNTSV